MTTPFDSGRVLWYVTPPTVTEASAEAMIATIRERAPNVTGVLVKAWNGEFWANRAKAGRPRAISGEADVRYWADTLHRAGLKCYAWGVARGQSVTREADIMRRVAGAGVDALVVDVEVGPSYFVGTATAARTLARAAHQTGVHVGLCFDYRGQHPRDSKALEWLPYVGSLHPMAYHFHFQRPARAVLSEMAARLYDYRLPIVPALQGYSVGSRKYAAQDIPPTAAIALDQERVVGVSWFRYGGGLQNNEDGLGPNDLHAIAAVDPGTQTPAEPVLFEYREHDGRIVGVVEVRDGRWRLPGAAGWMDRVPLERSR